ncbi:PASTA domain-containing protein [Leuconostoc lactis]|uniref:PASTA domain-containing protein n=1 Tax=Leuconostoc lactis TaxID=1246 RepID=UPI0025AFE767|nr:PASTA domain-containing protein [Leuconostoc lactis]MDN2650375.1 PASTA domain-containing protein [Leuconostoc lactis]
MNKTKLISTVGKIALGALAPELLAQGTKLVNAQLEKRKGYVKVPDVTALDVDEANEIMTQYHFNHTVVSVAPSVKYANTVPNRVVKTQPKGNTVVDPQTFVKLYTIDAETVQKSKTMAAELKKAKQKRQQAIKAKVQNTMTVTTKIPAQVTRKLKRNKNKR